MKPKTMLLMVVAVGCGLAASYMTSRLLAERSAAPAEEPKVKVLMAKQKVPAWVALKDPEKYFEEKELPESAVPKKALREWKDLKDQRLSQALSQGEYVLPEKLVNSDQVGLIAKLPSGMRAIALKVNAESLAGGFVLPGFRVDVVSTVRGAQNESTSKIILQNMLVLAVDTNAQRDPNSPSMLGSTVTLAATPEEATRLALAAALGELRLTLRTPDDTKIVRLPTARWDDLDKPVHDALGKEEEAGPLPAPPPVPPLPSLPKEPPPPTTESAVVVAKAPEKEPEPVQTHTMTIVNGEFIQKAIFLMDPVTGTWTRGQLDRNLEDAPPRHAAPPPPPPPPAATPAPGGPPAPAPAPAPAGARK